MRHTLPWKLPQYCIFSSLETCPCWFEIVISVSRNEKSSKTVMFQFYSQWQKSIPQMSKDIQVILPTVTWCYSWCSWHNLTIEWNVLVMTQTLKWCYILEGTIIGLISQMSSFDACTNYTIYKSNMLWTKFPVVWRLVHVVMRL